jgi:hypothetical protein
MIRVRAVDHPTKFPESWGIFQGTGLALPFAQGDSAMKALLLGIIIIGIGAQLATPCWGGGFSPSFRLKQVVDSELPEDLPGFKPPEITWPVYPVREPNLRLEAARNPAELTPEQSDILASFLASHYEADELTDELSKDSRRRRKINFEDLKKETRSEENLN